MECNNCGQRQLAGDGPLAPCCRIQGGDSEETCACGELMRKDERSGHFICEKCGETQAGMLEQMVESGILDAQLEDRDQYGRNHAQREWTSKYQRIDELDEDGDCIPDGEFSDGEPDEADLYEASDGGSDLDDAELKELQSQGFEICTAGLPDVLSPSPAGVCASEDEKAARSPSPSGVGASTGPCTGQCCALPEQHEPTTLTDRWRQRLLEALGEERIRMLRGLGMLDECVDQAQAMVVR